MAYDLESKKRKINATDDDTGMSVTHRVGMFLVNSVRPRDDIDGLDMRAYAYMRAYTLGVCEYLSLYLLGMLSLYRPPTKMFIEWMLHSAQANTIVRTGQDTYVWGGAKMCILYVTF